MSNPFGEYDPHDAIGTAHANYDRQAAERAARQRPVESNRDRTLREFQQRHEAANKPTASASLLVDENTVAARLERRKAARAAERRAQERSKDRALNPPVQPDPRSSAEKLAVRARFNDAVL